MVHPQNGRPSAGVFAERTFHGGQGISRVPDGALLVLVGEYQPDEP
jgi:hypothetical protein